MNIQPKLEFFGSIGIESATTDNIYYPEFKNGNWICIDQDGKKCKHMIYNFTKKQKYCRHIQEAIIEKQQVEISLLSKIEKHVSRAAFTTFRQAQERMIIHKQPELSYLGNLWLSIGYTEGQVQSDDVYEAVEGKCSHPNIFGCITNFLRGRGLIKRIMYIPSRIPTNHGAIQGVYILTDEGKQLVKNGLTA